MIKMRLRMIHLLNDDRRLLNFGAKIFVFAMLCGFVVGQSDTRYHGNADEIVFSGPVSSKSSDEFSKNEPTADSDTLIPLSLAVKLNSIDSADEFLELLRGVPTNERRVSLTSRFGEGEERSNAERALPAKCMPELQPVSLNLENDTSIIVYPSCTRVKRCGGCCSSALLSCQPTAVEVRNFEVFVASVHGLNYMGRRIVPLEEHTGCKCDCKIKQEHCNEKQEYRPDECVCACNNVDEAAKCRSNNETKLWNPELCTCICRTVETCSSGLYFDHNTCRCRQISLSRQVGRFGSTKGSNYNFGNTGKPPNVPPVIISLDASDPRRKHKEDPEYK